MEPHARLINCVGDDRRDRWDCVVVRGAPERAAVDKANTSIEARGEVRLRANADSETETLHLRITGVPTGAQAPRGPVNGWVRNLREEEPSVQLSPAP